MHSQFQKSIVLILGTILLATFAAAAPTGANATGGIAERGTETTATTVTVGGGNVTNVNITGVQLTGRWAGFFGRISTGLKLADTTNNIFYQWTITNVSNAVVYAANGSVTDFAVLQKANQTDVPSFLASGTAPDNYNKTFTQTATFSTTTITLTGVNYTTTWQNGSQGTQLRTYALSDRTNGAKHIWAGVAEYNVTGFKGGYNATDYQILVPADSSKITYTFYLELP